MEGPSKGTEQISTPDSSEKKNDYHIYPQLLAGFMANLTLMFAGIVISWPTLALPKLMDEKAEFHISSDQGAWIIAAVQSGACVGPILSALLVNRIGRKWFLYISGVPFLLCWILIYCVESFEVLFFARFISGIGVGGAFGAVPMYLGEIAEVRVRGALSAMLALMLNFGALTSYILGTLVDNQLLPLIYMIPIAIFLLFFCWMPETPYYFLKKNEMDDAKKSLEWLRKSTLIEKELAEMTDLIKKESGQRGKMIELITVPANRKATFIMWLLLTAQQCSGFLGIVAYAVIIFESTATILPSELQVVLTGAVSFSSGMLATCVIDKLGKKPLFIISSCGASLCLFAIAACFAYQEELRGAKELHWVPFAAVTLFHIFFSFGLGPIPYAILAEVYPTSVKAAATMVCSIYGSLVGVIVSKMLQVIADAFGYHTIFFAFCVIELTLMCIILFVVPETKGKTFKEIQEMLESKNAESEDLRV